MAFVETGQFDVNFVGTEASTMFLEPVFFDEDNLNEFRIMGNVPNKKKMGFVQSLEKIVRRYSGCGFNPVGSLDIYDREIEVFKQKAEVELCWDEFEDTVFEELFRPGVDISNLQGTQLEQWLLLRVRQAIRLDNQRLAYFGNRSSVNPAYDTVDGFWTVYYPELVSDDLIPRADTGSGADISAGEAIDMLKAVTEQADNRLKAMPNNMKRINVSGRVWEAYRSDLEDLGGGDAGRSMLINGQEVLVFRGIPVMPMWRWDQILETDLGVTKPNYIEYAATGNKVMATDVQDPAAQIRAWFEDKEEKLYVKARWKMGVDYVHNSLISVGY